MPIHAETDSFTGEIEKHDHGGSKTELCIHWVYAGDRDGYWEPESQFAAHVAEIRNVGNELPVEMQRVEAALEARVA